MHMTSEVKIMSKAGNSARISQPQFLEHVSGPGTKGTRGAMPKEVMQEDDAKNGKKNMNINMKCPEPTDACDQGMMPKHVKCRIKLRDIISLPSRRNTWCL